MRIVIIGNGIVGHKCCEKLITRNIPDLELVVFGEEFLPAYDRVHLSEYFSGKSAYDLSLAPVDWYVQNNILLHLGDPVSIIDRENKFVKSFQGKEAYYDYLIFATG